MIDFEQFYMQHVQRVFGVAFAHVQNHEDAEEITQDVFLKAYNNKDSFRKNAQYSTWLYRIAVNQSLDFVRAQKRMKRQFETGGEDIHQPDVQIVQNIDLPIIKKEFEEKFKLAVANLPRDQRIVFILFYECQCSNKEISEILQKTETNISSIKYRAIKKLKDILQN